MIEHSNIIYMPHISALGGIETYVYELVKKYHNLDIAVVCKTCNENQRKRIEKYCRVYIHTNQQIKCDVAIINYDQNIINYINEEANIYQTIHADYTNQLYDHKPNPNKRIKSFLGITQYLVDNMKDILKPNEIELCYNPLTISDKKPIVIVSATRLHKNKGAELINKFCDELDKQNVYYIWFILTNDIDKVNKPNVIVIPPRLDVDKFLSFATYVFLGSKTEACSYTLNEALFRNIPIITTPLPYLEEIGYKDGVNGYTINYDGSNIEELAKKITKIPKFTFDKFEDNYKNIFKKSKSKYEEEKKMLVKVRCICNYYDTKWEERKTTGPEVPYIQGEKKDNPNRTEWIEELERANHLVERKKIKIIDYLPNEPIKKENKKNPVKTEKRTK